mmetsp:Transcript_31469/g.53832  ORF Transcript_31469/g.53832 Transcript_31469/m.53832 type:complete len:398 (+) Transcript_31469:1335-2528(+)
MADYNRIMLAIRMRKRTKNNIDVSLNKNSKECTTNREDVEREPSTTTQKLIVNVSSRISTPNSFIVVDSLYGSYQLLEEMKDKKKIDGIYKCRSDRPTAIFSILTQIIKTKTDNKPLVGNYATMDGVTTDGNKFTAFSIVVKKKDNNICTYAHLLSTIHDRKQIGVKKAKIVDVAEKDPQHNHVQNIAEQFTGVIADYNKFAPFIDNVNDAIVSNLPKLKSTRWKNRTIIFILLIVINNAFRLLKLFAKENEIERRDDMDDNTLETIITLSKLTFEDFIRAVLNVVSPVPIFDVKTHFERQKMLEPGERCSFHHLEKIKGSLTYSNTRSKTIQHSCKFCFFKGEKKKQKLILIVLVVKLHAVLIAGKLSMNTMNIFLKFWMLNTNAYIFQDNGMWYF